MTSLDAPLNAAAVMAILAEPPLALLRQAGAPLIIAAGDPPEAVFASPSAVALCGAASLSAITEQLFSPAHGGARLAELARSLAPGGPARLERRRFIVGRRSEAVTLACRKLAGPGGVPVLVVSAQGVRSEPAGPTSAALIVGGAPDAAPTPPRSVEALRAALDARFAGRTHLRFLWQTDARHAVTALTSELADVVGIGPAGLIGGHLPDVVPQAGPALAEQLSRGETLSRIETLWPIAGVAAAVPVEISGVPVYGAERTFQGYRGFGVIHLDRLVGADAEAVGPAPPEPEAAVSSPGTDRVAADPGPAPRDATPQPVREAPAVARAPLPGPGPRGPATQNVVPLRPDGFSRGAADRVSARHLDPTRSVGLSSGERHAFREIARALGVRVHDEPGARPADREGGIDAEAVSQPQPDPGAEPQAEAAGNAAALLDRLPIGVMVIRAGAPLYLNRTLLELLGYADLDSFRGTTGLERMFRDRDPASLVGDAGDGTIPIVTREGEALTVNCLVQTADWDGEPATLLSFRRSLEEEIAPRLRALELELRARESEARELHAMLDTATDGIAVLDGEGRIFALNRSGEALFGYDQNDVAGESLTILLAPESHRTALDYLQSLKAEGVASVLNDGREVLGRERQGGVIPLFMTIGRLPHSAAQKFCAVLRDLTPWKKAEHELEEARRQAERASQLKSDFLARISHEIRTPLNAILGFAEVIMGERFGPVGNERYKDYLRDIHTSGSHVMSLVNDLLDLSKIEAGKMDLTFGSVDANKIVADCVGLMQPEANRERVIIRMALARGLPNVVADDRSLRQIVLNLLSNAVKFNEPGGQVIVSSVLTDAGDAVLRIRDTGIGMSESDVETALEPFRQLPTARQKPGTGLGLPLTKALVEANRATFTIKSKKNEGTLVEIAFPSPRVATQ